MPILVRRKGTSWTPEWFVLILFLLWTHWGRPDFSRVTIDGEETDVLCLFWGHFKLLISAICANGNCLGQRLQKNLLGICMKKIPVWGKQVWEPALSSHMMENGRPQRRSQFPTHYSYFCCCLFNNKTTSVIIYLYQIIVQVDKQLKHAMKSLKD